jgi:hypothetical protein
MQHPVASAVTAAPSLSDLHRPRAALALGMVGALGEELLAALVGEGRYATVHVGVDQPIGTAAARFRPWVVGDGIVLADDAYVCITGDETFVPKATPMRRVASGDVVAAARTARDCGASRLVLVSPLPALLQLNAASHTLSSASEVEIAQMGFQSLLVIRPTADAAAATGGWFPGVVRTFTRMVVEIMLPQRVQALRARTAAAAILTAVDRATPGIHVLGAQELTSIVDETMPGALPKKVRLR